MYWYVGSGCRDCNSLYYYYYFYVVVSCFVLCVNVGVFFFLSFFQERTHLGAPHIDNRTWFLNVISTLIFKKLWAFDANDDRRLPEFFFRIGSRLLPVTFVCLFVCWWQVSFVCLSFCLFVCMFFSINPVNPYFAPRPGLEVKPLGVYSLGPRSSSCGPVKGTPPPRNTLRTN